MACTLKGVVRYDGAAFSGWQVQPHARTVQGALEAAMAQIAGEPVRVQGAGRTDAGVHALAQVFSCRWPGEFPDRLRHALSRMLRPSIQVTALEQAPDAFNARFGARRKTYAYSLDLGREPDPFAAPYAWHVPYAVDIPHLEALLGKLTGTHDFAGFQSTGNVRAHTVRTLYGASLHQGALITPADAEHLWRIEFCGDGFLYRMVRNLTGTLIEIARGRFPATFLDACLASPGPFRGHCAPAHGLALVSVVYDGSSETGAPR
ncbi:MAG: tRNA pseudouridine(38-40) synthase TruA [Candidatus Hydrogenedentota bacterium]